MNNYINLNVLWALKGKVFVIYNIIWRYIARDIGILSPILFDGEQQQSK